MKVLVLGASGMLGNAMIRVLADDKSHEVVGTARSETVKRFFTPELAGNIIAGIDVEDTDKLTQLITEVKPDVVINCIGLVKQLDEADDPLYGISINALLPHRLAKLCNQTGSRLVHFSTDCVFSGKKGGYLETDIPDAQDLYGRTKLLGEVDYPHTITLRTSIIGHELSTSHGLINWFLAQNGTVKGYSKAIFSGLPTCELARVINKFVLPRNEMHGIYHVASTPISKLDLLELINKEYEKGMEIIPDAKLKIDRSLDSTQFQEVTDYVAPSWMNLVAEMKAFH
ncbi:SDR family oxidoreductase [Gammaproteobacteria bacterium]|nr:SDR family oxidoreductase [Gammaproteobacteria bacterium]